MYNFTFNGTSFEVDHAVKGADFIHCYDADGKLIVAFDRVSDFSGFTYSGTYMEPGDCMEEACNVVLYVGGKLIRRDGGQITPENIGAALAPIVSTTDITAGSTATSARAYHVIE